MLFIYFKLLSQTRQICPRPICCAEERVCQSAYEDLAGAAWSSFHDDCLDISSDVTHAAHMRSPRSTG